MGKKAIAIIISIIFIMILVQPNVHGYYANEEKELTIDQEVQYLRAYTKTLQARIESLKSYKKVKVFSNVSKESSFWNMDVRTASNATENDLEEFLKGTKLEGLGKHYIKAESLYRVNALFLVALSALESGWGKSGLAIYKNNLFGFHAYDRDPYNSADTFPDKKTCILYVSNYLKINYLSKDGKYFSGYTISDINKRYATSTTWDDKIISIMNRYVKEIK